MLSPVPGRPQVGLGSCPHLDMDSACPVPLVCGSGSGGGQAAFSSLLRPGARAVLSPRAWARGVQRPFPPSTSGCSRSPAQPPELTRLLGGIWLPVAQPLLEPPGCQSQPGPVQAAGPSQELLESAATPFLGALPWEGGAGFPWNTLHLTFCIAPALDSPGSPPHCSSQLRFPA